MKQSFQWCLLFSFLVFFSLTASSQTYYIVRHAEKATGGSMPTNDPPLSRKGEKRAQALKELLKNKKIGYIYSTNYVRTLSTARPLSQSIHVAIQTYVDADVAFIRKLKSLKKNVLIVGHSNTIDDITNALTNEQSVAGDIPDSVYNNLFVVQYGGRQIKFDAKKYGL